LAAPQAKEAVKWALATTEVLQVAVKKLGVFSMRTCKVKISNYYKFYVIQQVYRRKHCMWV